MESERLVALLRGVNVGGVTVKSAPLAAVFVEQGFTSVRTVLASGNVVFDVPDAAVPTTPGASASLTALKGRIEAALEREFGYDAWIVLVSQPRLAEIAEAYPFPRTDATDHPYVVFSSDEGVAAEVFAAAQELRQELEVIRSGPGVLYWRVPRGSTLDTPFAKLLAKSRYKPHVTTRNLRTVEKLVLA